MNSTYAITTPGAKFICPCSVCAHSFNAYESQWCDCIGPNITPRCTNCGRCFCDASNEYHTEFWKHAPKEIHALRRRFLGEPARRNDRLTALPTAAPGALRHPLVLVVDDSKLIRITTLRAVRALGYEAIEAADAEHAIDLARMYRPDIVISDALMPRMDGRDMCRTIKNDDETRHIKVVIMTGLYTAPHYKYEAFRRFGADEYLNKPIDPEKLRLLLDKLVGPPMETRLDVVA